MNFESLSWGTKIINWNKSHWTKTNTEKINSTQITKENDEFKAKAATISSFVVQWVVCNTGHGCEKST